MNQAEDRAHRIGQQNSVNIYYLYGKNTVDDVIFHILSFKSEVVSDALDGKLTDYKIKHQEKDDFVEKIQTLKESGHLNPVVASLPQEQPLENYFNRANDFVKRIKKSTSKRRKKLKQMFVDEEDIEDDDEEYDSEDGANFTSEDEIIIPNRKKEEIKVGTEESSDNVEILKQLAIKKDSQKDKKKQASRTKKDTKKEGSKKIGEKRVAPPIQFKYI